MAFGLLTSAFSQKVGPFLGRWDFSLGEMRASWLGISDKNGSLEVWYQPIGGNVVQLKDVKIDGNRLIITISSGSRGATTWELEATGDKLTGVQRRGQDTRPLTGLRAPVLQRDPPHAWSDPEPLFNGRNLDGWEPIGDPANHWVARDGLLVNEDHGANLKTTRKFDDFEVHFEVNCPDQSNSGFYLRGRYEIQLEYEVPPEPPERGMGSIYGRIAPKGNVPRTPGQWETFDVTLVGRTVSIVRNGVNIVDRQEIEGITGGALDANEGEPGPFYIQGDHTGGLEFRNITVSVPLR
jgi:hypothetical protein